MFLTGKILKRKRKKGLTKNGILKKKRNIVTNGSTNKNVICKGNRENGEAVRLWHQDAQPTTCIILSKCLKPCAPLSSSVQWG